MVITSTYRAVSHFYALNLRVAKMCSMEYNNKRFRFYCHSGWTDSQTTTVWLSPIIRY